MRSLYNKITNESILSSTNTGKYALYEKWAERTGVPYYKDGDTYIFKTKQRFDITDKDPIPQGMKIGLDDIHFVLIKNITLYDGLFSHENWRYTNIYITDCTINDFSYFPRECVNLLINNCDIKSFKNFPQKGHRFVLGNNKQMVTPKDLPSLPNVVKLNLLGNCSPENFGNYNFHIELLENDIKHLDEIKQNSSETIKKAVGDAITDIRLGYMLDELGVRISIYTKTSVFTFKHLLDANRVVRWMDGESETQAIGSDVMRKLSYPKILIKLCKKALKYKLKDI